jgi:hypothetical protein
MKTLVTLIALMASMLFLGAQTNTTTGFVATTASGALVPVSASDVANSLGVPQTVLDVVPVKYLPWVIVFIWLLPYVLRAYHAYQLGGSTAQITKAVLMGTNVPIAMKVQATGQPVVPTVPDNSTTAPKV